MKTPKSLVEVNGQLVSVSVDYIHPPIPYRGNDWNARYTDDEAECPNYGWGATAEDAIQNLLDCYDPDETGHDYEPDYSVPTAREEQMRAWNEKHNL